MPYKNKEDRNAQSRRWKRANRDKVNESQQRYRDNNRERTREYDRIYYHSDSDRLNKQKVKRQQRIDFLHSQLGKQCVNCGSEERLEFDHINPSLKQHRTPPQQMGRDKMLQEIDNLQVLCYECHKQKSLAQKAAAWHLYCQLSEQEQSELCNEFINQSGKPTSSML